MSKAIRIATVISILAIPQLATAKPVDLTLGSGDVLRVEPVAASIIRVRLSADGKFEPSLMERYGIVRTDWPECKFSTREESGVTRISTEDGCVGGARRRRPDAVARRAGQGDLRTDPAAALALERAGVAGLQDPAGGAGGVLQGRETQGRTDPDRRQRRAGQDRVLGDHARVRSARQLLRGDLQHSGRRALLWIGDRLLPSSPTAGIRLSALDAVSRQLRLSTGPRADGNRPKARSRCCSAPAAGASSSTRPGSTTTTSAATRRTRRSSGGRAGSSISIS